MKQILQNISNGETSLVDVPCPQNKTGNLLIASQSTLLSAGTERMLVDFGKANWIDKARQQPDKVRMVLDKVKTDGLSPTIEAVRSKLDQPLPLGYCNSGVVLESGADGFESGDRVVSNGNHAEVVRVPKNLCAKIPDNVSSEEAAFTVVGAIGLQGIRLIQPTLGECVVVTGLGLIGLLAVQMLRAQGCRVLGIDFDSKKCELAREFGAETVDLSKEEDPVAVAQMFSRSRGVDAVLVTASTKSNDVMRQAATMCRKRGRIVLVGVVGLNLSRADFFEKELTFQVSCSYGPGRYDANYEDNGNDYPVGYVRWTEQRNFEAVLDLMSSGQLNVKPLITHRFNIEQGIDAYKLLDDNNALGILLNYNEKPVDELQARTVNLNTPISSKGNASSPVCAFLGAGNYSSRVLIPAFKNAGVTLDTLVTSGGVSGVHHGKKQGFQKTSTDAQLVFEQAEVNTVVIATQHNLHAQQVLDCIKSGKHTFVEKPLALTTEELDQIESSYRELNGEIKPKLMIGFNRRFSPHVVKMKSLLASNKEVKSVIITVNAGNIPEDHWTQIKEIGGGRIIGEGCHFIDLMRHLIGHSITNVQVTQVGDVPGVKVRDDKATITLSFSDGSHGTIHYLANGGKAFPKERVEVFCGDGVLQLDNFRKLVGYAWPGFKSFKTAKQDKGQSACVKAFVDSIANGVESPIDFEEIIEVSRVTLKAAKMLWGES